MASAKQEVLLISPYVSSATIAAILADVDGAVGVTLITSLVPANFASGASDIEGLLAVAGRRTGAVRALPRLHAKAYLCDWGRCWVGSANFTAAGLAMGGPGNIEILAELSEPPPEFSKIVRSILHRSHPVEQRSLEWIRDQIPEWRARRIDEVESLDMPSRDAPTTGKRDGREWGFLFQELPFLDHPLDLCRPQPDHARLAHDRFLFGIEAADSEAESLAKCRAELQRIPVVMSLVETLSQPRWFGELSSWFHDRCEDRPLPYRSEIKDLVNRVLNWLLALYPDDFRSARPEHSTCYGSTSADWSAIDGKR